MHLNFEKQPRKRLRIPGYDYNSPGYFFVTVCTNNRECLFGEISSVRMILNAAGQMIEREWRAIPGKYSGWEVDSFIVMPNHIHAILVLSELGEGPARGPASTVSLPDLMRNIKSYTTTCYRQGVKTYNWLPFDQRLWQRSYYEHIIRNNNSLEKIREYVLNNPLQWNIDQNNPNNIYGLGVILSNAEVISECR